MPTVNYSWTLPTIGETYDIWGGWLNTILTDIDAKMFARTGGTISGNVAVTGTGAFSGPLYMPQSNLLQWNSTGAAGGTNRAVVWGDSSGNLNFGNGPSNATSATLDAAGNWIHQGSSGSALLAAYQRNTASENVFSSTGSSGSPKPFKWSVNAESSIGMTLDASGNLLAGATSGTEHTLQKSAPSNYAATISNSSASNGYTLRLTSASAAAATWNLIDGFANGTAVFRTSGNGNVSNLNNSYGAISSKFYKTNIVDTSPKLPKILKIRVVNYNLIDDPAKLKQLGVIWEELNEISPGLCEESPDYEDVILTREVEKTVLVTVKKEVTTGGIELEIIDGVAVQKVIRETAVIDEPVVDEYPVFDGDGNPVMVVVTPATDASPAVLRQKIHAVPRMETVIEKEEYTERRLTGTTTKSVKYSIFGPMLIKALQEHVEETRAGFALRDEAIAALTARIEALEARA